MDWEAVNQFLCCPEDREQLNFCGSEYFCRACSARFPILFGRIADLRSRRPQGIPGSLSPEFASDYANVFHKECEWNDNAVGWGARESVSKRWARRRDRQVEHIQSILRSESRKGMRCICDFSAGAGYYTFSFARSFPLVLHCDLSCDSLLYALLKAQKLGIDNIAFLRIDYLRPPFASTLDCVICMDSLERGEGHERMLLGEIQRSIRTGGMALVDFHNWWHNPVRRIGLLPENFGQNRSYTRKEVEEMLRSCGIGDYAYLPFYQEITPFGLGGLLCTAILPPARHVFLFRNASS